MDHFTGGGTSRRLDGITRLAFSAVGGGIRRMTVVGVAVMTRTVMMVVMVVRYAMCVVMVDVGASTIGTTCRC